MTECDNSKIHIRSNFLLSICILIITLQYFATLHHTLPNYT